MLQKLLGSQARVEILKNLFTLERKTVHLRELSRLSQLSAPVLLRELRQELKEEVLKLLSEQYPDLLPC